MLLGVLPLSQHVELDNGRSVFIDEGSLEQWAFGSKLLVPVLVQHDAQRLVGWCDKVTFSRKANTAMFYGELDPGAPDARGVAQLVRSHVRDGLSPGVKVSRGTKFYRYSGHYGDGDLVEFPELSVVWQPRLAAARWLGV